MAETDLIQLYSKRILALAADMPLTAPIEGANGTAKARSPLCGSTVSVSLREEEGKVAGFSQDVKACALGQASAAVLGGAVIGRSREEIAAGREALRAMLKEGAPPPGDPFEALEVLEPAKDYRNRHASILLAWDATLQALDEAAKRRTG